MVDFTSWHGASKNDVDLLLLVLLLVLVVLVVLVVVVVVGLYQAQWGHVRDASESSWQFEQHL